MTETPTPPADDLTATERALAGCMCLATSAIDSAVAHGIEAAAITDAEARAVIAAAMTRHAAGLPVDALTIEADSGIDWPAI